MSFLYVWNREKSNHSIITGIAGAVAFILFGIAIGQFAEFERFNTSVWETPIASGFDDDFPIYEPNFSVINVAYKLTCAYDIAVFILALAATAFVVYIFVTSRRHTELRGVSPPHSTFFIA